MAKKLKFGEGDSEFWANYEGIVGLGDTPDGAYRDLCEKLAQARRK